MDFSILIKALAKWTFVVSTVWLIVQTIAGLVSRSANSVHRK